MSKRRYVLFMMSMVSFFSCDVKQRAALADDIVGVPLPTSYPSNTWVGHSEAIVRILNRLDSHAEKVILPVGNDVVYRTLKLKASACVSHPDTLPAESAVQLHIQDEQSSETPHYEGWMFVNNPSVGVYGSSLYDVQIVGCQGKDVAPFVEPLPVNQAPSLSSLSVSHVDADNIHPVSTGTGGTEISKPLSLLPPPTVSSGNSQ